MQEIGASVELNQYRKDRLTLEPLKEEYLKKSDAALSDMRQVVIVYYNKFYIFYQFVAIYW